MMNAECGVKNERRSSIPHSAFIIPHSPLRPNLHFALEMDLVLIPDLLADDLHELHHVVGFRARVGHDEVRVLVAHLSAADAKTLEPRLVDQRAGAEPAGVLEDAPAVLGV